MGYFPGTGRCHPPRCSGLWLPRASQGTETRGRVAPGGQRALGAAWVQPRGSGPGLGDCDGQRAWPAGRTWPFLTLTGTSGKPVRQRREIDWFRSKDQKPGAQEVVGTMGPRLGQPASPMRVCPRVPRGTAVGEVRRPHPALRSPAGLQGNAGRTGACQRGGVSRDPRGGGRGTPLGLL